MHTYIENMYMNVYMHIHTHLIRSVRLELLKAVKMDQSLYMDHSLILLFCNNLGLPKDRDIDP
jgi:hypothetical protein